MVFERRLVTFKNQEETSRYCSDSSSKYIIIGRQRIHVGEDDSLSTADDAKMSKLELGDLEENFSGALFASSAHVLTLAS